MDFDKFVKKGIKGAFEKLFDLDKFRFTRIAVKSDVIDSVMDLAKENHPKEFLAFLDGKIKDGVLTIDGILYQEYYATDNSAAPIFHFPDKSFYGCVHSHPGYSNRPSNADRMFFRKIGIINMIICRPYDKGSIRFYNHEGEEIKVDVEE